MRTVGGPTPTTKEKQLNKHTTLHRWRKANYNRALGTFECIAPFSWTRSLVRLNNFTGSPGKFTYQITRRFNISAPAIPRVAPPPCSRDVPVCPRARQSPNANTRANGGAFSYTRTFYHIRVCRNYYARGSPLPPVNVNN